MRTKRVHFCVYHVKIIEDVMSCRDICTRRRAMKELSVPIAAGGKKPIYEQIYDYIKKEIRDKNG